METQTLKQLAAGEGCSREQLLALVEAEGPLQQALWAQADRVRARFLGQEVHLRALLEISNYCCCHCLYCGLRSANGRLQRYRMSPEEIVDTAKEALQLGYKTVVLQSGEDPWYDGDKIAGIVSEIKKLGLAVTLSLGERRPEELALWRRVGADRYLLRHETIDRELYQWLHPGRSLEARLETLEQLRGLGYQVGAGMMVGLPQQRTETLVEDLLFLRRLPVDMAGIGPFVANGSTPLADAPSGRVDRTLNVVALARLLMPYAHLPATTALGALESQGRWAALQVGANVVMPNITPREYRDKYELYPNKNSIQGSNSDARENIEKVLQGLNRRIGQGYGHSRLVGG